LTSDSTLVYPAKVPGGLEARITFCSQPPGKSTGQRRGVSSTFTAEDDARVYAFVDLTSERAWGERPLEFHLVWVGPDHEVFYKKRMEHAPADSGAPLRSSIAIPPERRPPGEYTLLVYCFRELIAQRSLHIRHES
jgi:hypothetical protein